MASKAAVLRLAPLLRPHLSRAHSLRFDQTLNLIDDQARAVLADVLKTLFPGQEREASLTALRQFRQALSLAAEEAGVKLCLKSDRQTRSAPKDRTVWFEAEDRIVEEVVRLVDAEVRGPQRTPQDVFEDRPIRFFVSHAHNDDKQKRDLLPRLRVFLDNHPAVRFELWSDGEILPGESWHEEIQRAMKACDFGLLFVSPSFLASKFISKSELPFLLANKRVVPVAVKRVLFDGTFNLKGLEEKQLFFDEDGKTYTERSSENTRDSFVRQLYSKICGLLAKPSAPVIGRFEDHLRRAVEDFDEQRFVHTEGVMTSMAKGLEETPEIDIRQRKDAIDFLCEWLADENAQPYCALLGEYGMGKTTTCKALARHLLEQRERDTKAPLPIYLDLRHVGKPERNDLVLEEILHLILRRSWKPGPDGANLTALDLINLVRNEGALVIWDGLDEVLVHLEANPGQNFTRQLFRILPPTGKGAQRRGRMLISCRTHYFRTLRDQQSHFRAEDRDGIRREDYRPPFVLLPFTPDQIRQYLERALPSENPDRIMETIRAVHNLEELAERPYTLSLIVDRISRIEQWRLEGRKVTGLMLYQDMVLSWLERDTGKHLITPDHKQALMEYCAAELWRTARRFWSVADLEQWLIDFLESHPRIAAHYTGKGRELLKEDLRTATFLVREGEDNFRFAHTSLQEYFLAGFLRRALVEGRPEAWDLPRTNRETLDFLGQWLLQEPNIQTALATLGQLRDSYLHHASEMAFAYALHAVPKGYPAPSLAGFQLPGADLSEWKVAGTAGSPLVLAGINLRGARLWNSCWKHCTLQGAAFDQADALRAEFRDTYLAGSTWRGARLEAPVFRQCNLTGADFSGALCIQARFLRCHLTTAAGLPAGRPQAHYALCLNGTDRAETALGQSARLAIATGHHALVTACAWSPDGNRIVSASYDHTLRLWDVASGTCLATLSAHQASVLGCAWSPDGRLIVSASADNTLRIWDASSGASLATLSAHQASVNACDWSPDGRLIVSASADKTLRIWDAASGACLASLAAHQDSVRGCAWSPDGLRIVSASDDQTLRTWDAASGACLATLSAHQSSVTACAWSPDGQRIVSASLDKTLLLWEARSGTCLGTLSGHFSSVLGCAWSPDGQLIVSASSDKALRLWDAASGACLATLSAHQAGVWGCAWSPDGQRIVSYSWDNTLRIWDALSGACLAAHSAHTAWVWGCAWSPDGSRIVSTSADHTLRMWDASDGACLTTLSDNRPGGRRCAWSPDGQRIVSISGEGTLRIWDAGSDACLAILSGHQDYVWNCAWSPDGLRIVSASADNRLLIWDAVSAASLATLSGHTDSVWGCAWSPNGSRIVSASADNTLRIWDASSCECLATLSAHRDSVVDCIWSPGGRRILSASRDNTLRLWDASSGTCLATLSAHQAPVSSCAWSPDGTRIVSASADKTLRIWDASSGDCLAILSAHQAPVSSCAWSPDGRRIVSASADGTLRIWDAASGAEVGPTLYGLHAQTGEFSWCALDHKENRILACDSEAWRYLGWVVPDTTTGLPEMLPAETFGPLPVYDPR